MKPAYQRAPELKQELLLDAARELFLLQGYAATSTLQIARHAGVSEGILFHHFGSKKALFESLAEDFVRDSVAATMPPGRETTEEDIVRRAFDFADANPGLYQMLWQIGVEFGEPHGMGYSDSAVALVEEKLVEAMAHGKVRKGDPHIMAQLQFALVDAAYRAWLDSGDESRREGYIAEAVVCLRSMTESRPTTRD